MTRYVLDCASDTHGTHKALRFKKPHDLEDREWFFVHAGDSTKYGTPTEVKEFADWVATLPHPHRVCIAGNHERQTDPVWVENEKNRLNGILAFKALAKDVGQDEVREWREVVKRTRKQLKQLKLVDIKSILGAHCTFLEEESAEIAGVKFYGSPYTPRFYSWGYQYDRNPEADVRWAKIPEGTHVVVTHGPPNGILDEATDKDDYMKLVAAGCSALKRRLFEIKPQVHVFGHIHDWFGVYQTVNTTFVNASSVVPQQYQTRFKFIRVYGDTEKGVERIETVVTT